MYYENQIFWISYFVTSHIAWTTAGKYNKKQRTILIIKSLPAPFLRKTASGANRIAMIISTILLSMFLSSIDLGLNATSQQHQM
jgi:uncharacterized membrane protein YwzB